MKNLLPVLLVSALLAPSGFAEDAWQRPESLPPIPEKAPRTWILPDQIEEVRKYALEGEGAPFYRRIKERFDQQYLEQPFPEEPKPYGDPDPRKRTSDMVDAWREAQDTANLVGGIAATSAVLWRITGEDVYLKKAKDFLLRAAKWDPQGTTGLSYNDEANFRLLRLLPETYDQIREQLSDEERKLVVEMFRVRGKELFQHLLDKRTGRVKRNSLEVEPSSHPVRFMSMTGLMGLALWDDLPEAKDWFAFASAFYQNQFTPWGGDDGGWAEGMAYWRAVIEHSGFQDALLQIGDASAYQQPFWKNTYYFPVYFTTPWLSTNFGDLPNAGKINLEPQIWDALDHASRIYQDGYLVAFANLYKDRRPKPHEEEPKLWRKYPIPIELFIKDFIVSHLPKPKPLDLAELPQSKYLPSIGWVAMHTNLGQPKDDISLLFKSSPYGSFSHSHADQNAFILRAFGEDLAINSGYREFHRSPHHKAHTRQTLSKNALLINGEGQPSQNKKATGQITGFKQSDGFVWTRGDASIAYQANPKLKEIVEKVERDIVFVDERFFVIRDVVKLNQPAEISWLLHALRPPTQDKTSETNFELRQGQARLGVQLIAVNREPMKGNWKDKFAASVDKKYVPRGYQPQHHFTSTRQVEAGTSVLYSILSPSRNVPPVVYRIEQASNELLQLSTPDGPSWKLTFLPDEVVVSQEGQKLADD